MYKPTCLVLSALLIIFAIGCNNTDLNEVENRAIITTSSFKEVVKLRGKICNLEIPLINPTQVYVADSLLIIRDSYNDEGMILLFSIPNKLRYSGATGRSGEGPGEYVGLQNIKVWKNKLYAIDVTLSAITKLDIDSILFVKNYIPSARIIITRPKIQNFLAVSDSTFIVGYYGEEPRFSMINWQKEKLYSFLNYPELPNTHGSSDWDFKHNVMSNLYQVKLAYNLKRNLMVLSYSRTALLQVVDYAKGEVVLSIKGPDKSFPPEYVISSSGRGLLAKEAKMGYFNLVVTDNHIYGLYSGRTDKRDQTSNQILQYDWQGVPIKKYLLDRDLFAFTVDEKNNKIYGIEFSDTPLLEFDLPN